jgi:hypothetical protein
VLREERLPDELRRKRLADACVASAPQRAERTRLGRARAGGAVIAPVGPEKCISSVDLSARSAAWLARRISSVYGKLGWGARVRSQQCTGRR